MKTSLLIICEEPTSKHPVLEINNEKYCSYLKMLKCSIFKTSLLNIEQGSFLSQMSPSQKVCKYILPLHTLSKYMMFPLVLPPPPYFEAVYCFICCRRRVALARYRMICVVLWNNTQFVTRFLLLNIGNCYFRGNNIRSIFSTLYLKIDQIMTLRVFNLHIYESTNDL